MAGGRPNKLTPDVHEKIVKAIYSGCYVETAVALAGIRKQTFYNWIRRAKDEEERLEANSRAKLKNAEKPFVEFMDAVNEALAAAEARDIFRINQASENDWRASAWKLERKFPDRWGRRVDSKVAIIDGEDMREEETVDYIEKYLTKEE